MSNEKKTLHIVELRTENIKRIKAVHVTPQGAVITVGGKNGQGKTSLLDSIEMALGGGRAIPVDPVRHGAHKARIVVDLGDLIVERTFNRHGNKLVVRSADGETLKSPQKLLDDLCAKVTFDPLEFSRMPEANQNKLLKELMDLDFSKLEKVRGRAYDERAEVNREVNRLKVRLEAAPDSSDMPTKEVSVADLLTEIQEAEAAIEENDQDREAERKQEHEPGKDQEEAQAGGQHVTELHATLEEVKEDRVDLYNVISQHETDLSELAVQVEALEDPDTDGLREQIRTAEETNTEVRNRREIVELADTLQEEQTKADALTDTIQAVNEEKREMLAGAEFPVPGLGFDDTGVTLNDVPFEQASGAEKLRVSVAIGAALNPRVKIMLVRDGSLLDDESMALLQAMAEETGSQVWIERVASDGEGCSVFIEDGSVVE